ncbi:hypothetical protein [Pantoea vagans]|uniref:hypothetical protein n=1 Tax=Pantoea vagans TaxID=470934 RepID=UPI003B023FCE
MGTLQNRLINHNGVTMAVLAPQQDLNQGFLSLLIVPGRIRNVELSPSHAVHAVKTAFKLQHPITPPDERPHVDSSG